MDERSLQLLVGTITDQQYMFHLLVRILVEKGVLTSGEVQERYDQRERFQFGHDLLEQLVATGLRISVDQPSASPTESSSAPQQATTEATDPAPEKKS